MKTVFKSFAVLISIAALAGSANAARNRGYTAGGSGENSGELSLDVAGEPASGFGTTIGLTAEGVHKLQPDLALVGGFSYYNWSQGVFGFNLSYTRVPLAAGVRKYFPTQQKELNIYAQGELELSIDSVDVAATPTLRSTSNDVHVGFVPCLGAEYAFNPRWSGFGNFKYHIITDGYFVFSFGAAYHF